MTNVTIPFFDYNSTTPIAPEVLEAMMPFLKEQFGNPSSQHSYGWTAAKAVNDSRKQVAQALNCDPKEVIFTSGATESIHLAIMGIALLNPLKGSHFVTTSAEHSAVYMTFKNLEALGAEVTYLSVSPTGELDYTLLARSLKDNTQLVSVIHANNEVGTINDLKKITEICKNKSVPLHVDAAQSFTKILIDTKTLPIDLISISAHKIYGPKGVGALFVRQGLKLATVIAGGSQEQGIRPGTVNVPGVVGLGKAVHLAHSLCETESLRLKGFQSQILETLTQKFGAHLKVNGCLKNRLPNNLNVTFLKVDSELLLQKVSRVAFSQSSACTSGSTSGSRVLRAIGLTQNEANQSIRLGLGRYTTSLDIDLLLSELSKLA